MLSRHYSLVFLAAALLGTLPSQSSFAFTINNPRGNNTPVVTYTEPNTGVIGITELQAWPAWDPRSFLDFGKVVEVKEGGTDKLVALLKNKFPTWRFLTTGHLEGSFDVLEYYPCTPTFPSPNGQCGVFNGGVGANLTLNYSPQRGSSDPRGNNVHWIQRIIDNLSGYDEDTLDIVPENQDNPYYDDGGAASPTYFRDIPWTSRFDKGHYFYAETYLVEEIAPQTVKIYNGVRWGWENSIIRLMKKFSDSLASGYEVDTFRLDELPKGAKFAAWIDNDLPSNQCNPNTYLTAYNGDGSWMGYDNNSSPLGDGFASALTGTVGSNGIINLFVQAASGGRRGEDKGNYELYVKLYDEQESPEPEFSVGDSGGGGVGDETPGRTQQNPILPSSQEEGWQVFRNVRGCKWYDPHTPYGFEFQALDNTLFTSILDFPVGDDNLFTVSVGDTILGEFGPGSSVDFVDLFGSGVSNFKITGIDSLFGETRETAFPIQLTFNDRYGSFKMRSFEKTPRDRIPEPSSIFGLLVVGAFSAYSFKKRKQ